MPRILIVDDEREVLEVLQIALEEEGFDTIAVESGESALEAYEAQRPDAVLLDLSMPVMDGLATLQAIRRIDPNARVAMLTAVGTKDAVRDALAAGARDFVLKPFDLHRIRSAVDELLAA